MIYKIIKFKTTDNSEFSTELEAITYEASYWENKVKEQKQTINNFKNTSKGSYEEINDWPHSSYGSSGGGGHD